jgi:hypothetical protein
MFGRHHQLTRSQVFEAVCVQKRTSLQSNFATLKFRWIILSVSSLLNTKGVFHTIVSLWSCNEKLCRIVPIYIYRRRPGNNTERIRNMLAPCSLGLSATSQQYFSLRKNQPPATSQQYFSLRTNQHQPSATSQTNTLQSLFSSNCLVISGSPGAALRPDARGGHRWVPPCRRRGISGPRARRRSHKIDYIDRSSHKINNSSNE